MTPAQKQVHEKLMQSLPVRTHQPVPPPRKRICRVRTAEQIAAMKKRARQLKARGWTNKRISEHMHESLKTVHNLLRKRTDIFSR